MKSGARTLSPPTFASYKTGSPPCFILADVNRIDLGDQCVPPAGR